MEIHEKGAGPFEVEKARSAPPMWSLATWSS